MAHKVSRDWIFTQYGSVSHEPNPRPEIWLDGMYKYLIYQLESGSKTHLLHFQGYVIFKRSQTKERLITRSERLAPRNEGYNMVEWAIRRGTHAQARDYASKGTHNSTCKCTGCQDERIHQTRVWDEPFIGGKEPNPGARTDWFDVRRLCQEGAPLRVFDVTHPRIMLQCGKGVQEMRNRWTPPRDWKMDVAVIYGPGDVGKNVFIHRMHDPSTIYTKVQFFPETTAKRPLFPC